MNGKSVTTARSHGYLRHAAIARDLAEQCQSAGARTALLEMAQRYERLAAFADAAPAGLPRRVRPVPLPAAPTAIGLH